MYYEIILPLEEGESAKFRTDEHDVQRWDNGWYAEPDLEKTGLVLALADISRRANEYHDTTQEKRIAELEQAVTEAGRQLKNMAENCYQPGALHCSACGLSLAVARETLGKVLPEACPCGGGPGHGSIWCADYTEGLPT